MITRQLSGRVARIERTTRPADAGMFTIEELCRYMWRRNPAHCRELSEEPGDWVMRSYIPIFQADDARRSQERSA